MRKKILVVLTSVVEYPNLNRATGLWLGEAVRFVKKVEVAGYEVDYVSPQGGYNPKVVQRPNWPNGEQGIRDHTEYMSLKGSSPMVRRLPAGSREGRSHQLAGLV